MRAFPGQHFLRFLLHNRHLVYQLVRRDFRQRYVGSIVGWVWGLIHPLVLLAVYTFVFSYAFNMRLPKGEVTDNYPLFLFAGMLPWLLFSETVQRSASSLPEYANLIKKSVFPSEILPVSIFFSTLISHGLALVLLLVAAVIWLGGLSPWILVLPVYVALLGLLSVGLGWIFASVHVFLRDTAHVLTVVLTAWFWLTPIFLYEAQFGDRLQPWLRLNPLLYVVRGYRDAILGSHWNAVLDLAVLAGMAGVMFILGGLVFRHLKRGFADVL